MQKRLTRQVNSQATERDIDRAINRVYDVYGTNWDAFLSAVRKDRKEEAEQTEPQPPNPPQDRPRKP